MAWRDSRRSRSRLLLFMSSIVLGIAALVGINSFGHNLARSISEQSRELLGADLVLHSTQPFDSTIAPDIARLGQRRTTDVAFASLVLFPRTQGVRLAQVRNLSGDFPYYGAWEIAPASARAAFRAGRGALVDDVLLAQFKVKVGDSVKVGEVTLPVLGRVLKTPGQSGMGSAVAPTVFLPGQYLARTGLVQRGSRISYRTYVQFAEGTDVAAVVKGLQKRLDKASIESDTVASRQQRTGRAFSDLTEFLSLVAFVALLLGCVGVASAVNLYVREKLAAVAVLRCLGASGRQAVLIYLLQTSGLGLLGAIIGAALGAGVQFLLPQVLGSFLPVEISVGLAWPAIGLGLVVGLLMAVLFALLPLLSIRRVSPLRVLRAAYDEDTAGADPIRWAVYAAIGLFIVGFTWFQTHKWLVVGVFSGSLLVSFGLLTGLGLLLMKLLRRYFPVSWSYVWRQGLANLFRPNNQTLTLITSVGLGTFLLATLYLVQALLLGRMELKTGDQQPNLVLFDIQREQLAGVENVLKQRQLPIIQRLPVVTMRLLAINQRTVAAIKRDTTDDIPPWALTSEYRVTYRDSLSTSETLLSGRPPYLGKDGLPHISVDAGYAKNVHLKLGDTLTFNVQGSPMQAVIGGTREVDWTKMQSNFLVVFPKGVLEQAPQFEVVITRVPSTAQLAEVQRTLVAQFPNVSAIDIGLILNTLNDIITKVSFVIRFMAAFSIITGLLVLASSVIISRYQRIQESVLLRTLGASRRQILLITLVEYALLGALAAGAGIGLAAGAGWALAAFVFEVSFAVALPSLLGLAAVVTAITALLGLLNSREVLRRPPLEVLRGEG
ncbi:ABC transporter permease [Hymenobacter sp. ASUV-10]|uniref:ABC transporter permease n=2 Tax=Hymenobacter aranciens TaxID=3063996 RepID=A0ABT9BDA1_9BACT|nr:FtsX-like permease family protein [Hymenobacter sp. ASUV-10]MDO7876230.1 ABC transporter permease [Hymenobacter sp. ASUV-10]